MDSELDAKNKAPVNPEARWRRLQEFGLYQILSIPVVMMAVVVVKGDTIVGHSAAVLNNMILMVSLALATSGYCCIRIGYDKRAELRNKDNGQD